ncbi:MAG: dockerin type I domain-containing protein [Planctomycetota bacterium]
MSYVVKLGCVLPTADSNLDGVVNLLDLAALQNCFSGSAPTTCNPGCYRFDFDGDDDIDLLDFADLQRVFTAP